MIPLVFSRSSPLPLGANREFALPADGWFQLAAPGEVDAPLEFPNRPAVPIVQVLDLEAASAIAAAFNRRKAEPNFGGVLVDFEHFSYDESKETRAAMWIDDLQVRGGGELWIKPRVTNSGKQALEGGDWRFISPVFLFPNRAYQPGERVRPAELDTAGLTNRPRLKGMVPLSNRQPAATAERSETQPTNTMKKVLKALGLADDASEDSAVAALALVQNRASHVETLTTERDTLLAAQVELDLTDAGLEGDARKPWQAALLKNRADTLPLLAGLKAAKPAPAYGVTHNRSAAKAPAGGATTAKNREGAQLVAVNAHKTANRCSFQQAWEAVRMEKPELFADEPSE